MDKANFFNSALINIIFNFISNTIVKCSDQDPPLFGEKSKLKLSLKLRFIRNTWKMVDHRLFLFTVELLREINSYVFKIQKWYLLGL